MKIDSRVAYRTFISKQGKLLLTFMAVLASFAVFSQISLSQSFFVKNSESLLACKNRFYYFRITILKKNESLFLS